MNDFVVIQDKEMLICSSQNFMFSGFFDFLKRGNGVDEGTPDTGIGYPYGS